jgi:hypothetical protein
VAHEHCRGRKKVRYGITKPDSTHKKPLYINGNRSTSPVFFPSQLVVFLMCCRFSWAFVIRIMLAVCELWKPHPTQPMFTGFLCCRCSPLFQIPFVFLWILPQIRSQLTWLLRLLNETSCESSQRIPFNNTPHNKISPMPAQCFIEFSLHCVCCTCRLPSVCNTIGMYRLCFSIYNAWPKYFFLHRLSTSISLMKSSFFFGCCCVYSVNLFRQIMKITRLYPYSTWEPWIFSGSFFSWSECSCWIHNNNHKICWH